MKLMRIHHCFACKYSNWVIDDKPIRVRCYNSEAKTKKGNARILNKKKISRGEFPEWCPLEDADFNVPKISDRG